MADEFDCPQSLDESPLHDATQSDRRGIIARRFRAAAEQYRRPAPGTRLERLHLGNGRHAEYPAGLHNKCGQWIIDAHRAGLIPSRLVELIALIDWHTGPEPELPPGRQSVIARCPTNLFHDVCGGHIVKGILRGEDERGRLILEDEREAAVGIMPRIDAGHLRLSEVERYAATCEQLADWIEEGESDTRPDYATAEKLAARYGLDPEATRKKLERYATKYPDCYIHNDQPKQGESRKIFRVADVINHLKRG